MKASLWVGSVVLSSFATLGCMSPTAGSAQVSPPPPPMTGWKTATLAEGLDHPWGMVWLPNGDMLITERSASIAKLSGGNLQKNAISGLPAIFVGGQGGLMDIALHPRFEQNGWVYLTASTGSEGQNRTELFRGKLVGNALQDVRSIFRVSQDKNGGQHFGSRILFLPDGTMLLSIGDGGNPPTSLNGEHIRKNAQKKNSHLGKVLRLDEEGKPAEDNPFVAEAGAAKEVFSLGHRNIQGLAIDPETGVVFANEHGARGGDELNRIQKGANYGWPEVTYSVEYWGPKISEETTREGMVDPIVAWTPSPGCSGLAVYRGDKYPGWEGDIFSGGLASRDIRRVRLDGDKVVTQERMEIGERVRDVRQGPDGYLYLITDEGNGKLMRIERTNG